jgi:aspartate/methionine/tyrosine aminotransferase
MALAGAPAVSLLLPEGGWYAPIRLPATRSSEAWALSLLEHDSVYVHPGSFFGFESEVYLVVSLLPSEDVFDEGVRRIVRAALL